MLSKSKRINLKKDFKWMASGKKIDSKYLRLFIKVGDNQTARIGITTSSRVFRKATDRNRAKRLASAAFELVYSKLPPTINLVALPKVSILDVKSGDVLLDLEEALMREKVIIVK